MKLFTKIFLCTVAVITLTLSMLGYTMLKTSFKNALARERESCISEYQLLKFALQSHVLSAMESGGLDEDSLKYAARQTVSAAPGAAAVLTGDGGSIVSGFPEGYDFSGLDDSTPEAPMLKTESLSGGEAMTAAGRFTQSGYTFILVSSRDISSVFDDMHEMRRGFITSFIIAELLGAAIMAAVSYYISAPLKRLTKSTRRFEAGDYSERITVRSRDETGELSRSFNSMAGTVEGVIERLELASKQKDDFTASFAHELKTPLTSVIGYADMIYQKNDMTRAEIKDAAGYILNEGMRLEALSFKLMELIVLEKQDFTLALLPVNDLIADAADTLRPMLSKKNAELELNIEPAYVKAEPDLFKTLMLNLADNAAKAGAGRIVISGSLSGNEYALSVKDDGRGISKEHLKRITEAFYMVDKSRSRREHGAGLGLAIAQRIAKLHGTTLAFSSEPGQGTKVSLVLYGEAE